MDPLSLTILGGVIVAAVVGVARGSYPILKKRINHLDLFDMAKCRIFVYGHSRSGKTTLIQRLVTISEFQKIDSTIDFIVYPVKQYLNLEQTKPIEMLIGDYRGQKPSQILVNPPEKFFGKKDNRIINIILFVVDLFPEYLDGSRPKTVDEIIEQYGDTFQEEIKTRVSENLEYINPATLEPALAISFNQKTTCAIRLLINKQDILQRFCSEVGLPNNHKSSEEYSRHCYAKLEEQLQDICKKLDFTDFEINIISAVDGDSARTMFGEVVKIYAKRFNAD